MPDLFSRQSPNHHLAVTRMFLDDDAVSSCCTAVCVTVACMQLDCSRNGPAPSSSSGMPASPPLRASRNLLRWPLPMFPPPSPSGSDRSRPSARVPHRQQKRFVIGCYSYTPDSGGLPHVPPPLHQPCVNKLHAPPQASPPSLQPSMYDPSDGRPQISACMLPHAASTQGLRRLAYNRERAEGIYPPETF